MRAGCVLLLTCSCATLLEVACERFLRARAGQGESHADLRSSLAVPPSRSLALRPSRGRVRRSRGQQRLVRRCDGTIAFMNAPLWEKRK
jgi:hypothetical protein